MDHLNMENQSGVSVEKPSKCSGCLKCTRGTLSFLLTNVGLVGLVVGYCLIGAFIFEELEKHNEIVTKRNMKSSRLAMSANIWDITRDMEVLHEQNWTKQVTESLRKFEKSLLIALKEKGWDGKEDEDVVSWSFAGALFYSITVITTIGYGHIAPKTAAGKVVTIFYAILGIPITVICWSNIGDAMAKAFRFAYWKICCYVYTKKTKKRRKRMLSRHRGVSVRHPQTTIRRKSVRSRGQRPSQRSADSKITAFTGDSKSTYLTVDSSPLTSPPTSPLTSSLTTPACTDSKGGSPVVVEQKPVPTLQLQPLDSLSTKQLEVSREAEIELVKEVLENASVVVQETPTTPPKEEAKIPHKAGDKMKEVSEKVMNKIKSAKKSANLSLEFDPKKIEIFKSSPDTEASPSLYSEEGRGFNARARALLRAEKDSQKSQHSGSGGSNASHGPTTIAIPMIARGQRVARHPDDYDDQSYYEEYYYADSEDDLDETKRPVPILLSLLLVVGYIVGGAFLFQMWEGWSFLDSAYFCFITLTTIGFGDFTPDQNTEDGEKRIALCSMYLLFGIAMIAMSFNLVQEEVINSVKSVGKMLGIVKDSDEDDDY